MDLQVISHVLRKVNSARGLASLPMSGSLSIYLDFQQFFSLFIFFFFGFSLEIRLAPNLAPMHLICVLLTTKPYSSSNFHDQPCASLKLRSVNTACVHESIVR